MDAILTLELRQSEARQELGGPAGKGPRQLKRSGPLTRKCGR